MSVIYKIWNPNPAQSGQYGICFEKSKLAPVQNKPILLRLGGAILPSLIMIRK